MAERALGIGFFNPALGGDPILYQQSTPVEEFGTEELNQLISDMLDTMESLDGAGLAAPQIGIGKRVVIFGVEHNPRYPEAEEVPQTVLINPVIEPQSDEIEDGWEGCLSIPGMSGVVPRYKKVRYRGYDQHGGEIDRIAEDFHARVVQHECDHLDGILYPMRINNVRMFGYTDVLFPEPNEGDAPISE